MTYLDHFERPSLDIPFSLRDTSHVVVDEQTFGLYFENESVCYLAHVGNELGDRFRKQVVEEIHRLDDNLVRVRRGIRP